MTSSAKILDSIVIIVINQVNIKINITKTSSDYYNCDLVPLLYV